MVVKFYLIVENDDEDIKESDVNSDDMRKTKKFCYLI